MTNNHERSQMNQGQFTLFFDETINLCKHISSKMDKINEITENNLIKLKQMTYIR